MFKIELTNQNLNIYQKKYFIILFMNIINEYY